MPTLLVVDDAEVDRRLIASLLEKQTDLEIQFAANGKQAMQSIRQDTPDLVLTDIVMPEMDGLQLLRQIRSLHPGTPVMLLTAHGNEATAIEALEQGAVSYVPKARQAQRLSETIHRVLDRLQAERRGRQVEGLEKLDCIFNLPSDKQVIAPTVNFVQQALAGSRMGDATERIRVGVALQEALENGVFHGQGDVRLKARLDSVVLRLAVSDQGEGFDVAETIRDASDCFAAGGVRGLMLITQFMDDVTFNPKGNQITMLKFLDPEEIDEG